MVGIPLTCKLCKSVEKPTFPISEFIHKIRPIMPITLDEIEDIESTRVCHECILDITLVEDVVVKYKDLITTIPVDKCYLCRKENVRFGVSGELYEPIRAVEESLTVKNMLPRNLDIDTWNNFRKCLNKRKICGECYFLVDTTHTIYKRIKDTDSVIRRVLLRARGMYYDESSSDSSDSEDALEPMDDEEIEEDAEEEEEVEEDGDENGYDTMNEDENGYSSMNEDENGYSSMNDDENELDDIEDTADSNSGEENSDPEDDILSICADDNIFRTVTMDVADAYDNGMSTPPKEPDNSYDSDISDLTDMSDGST